MPSPSHTSSAPRRTSRRRAASQSVPSTSFRPEIEGLRAVAVLLVISDHLAAWPRGGFVGVDVFFVISGYLITGLLVGEHERTGRISMKAFYQRRARRILPAAISVLAATWVVSTIVFFADRAQSTRVDILWSAGFLANFHFARAGTDYFNADRPPSPVQHFWSLAVEEQFYIFWPLILMALLWLGRRAFGRRAMPVLAGISIAAVGGLFVSAIAQTHHNAATAYFNTSARAWELGAGAVLAIALPLVSTHLRRVRGAALILGLVTILGSAWMITPAATFPAPIAAWPVLGAALVIVGSGGRRSLAGWPLTNPLSRYVGRVSYSLYLWHWPVIVILAAMMSDRSAAYKPLAILAMSALTIGSYHFVEAPLRTARWRSPRGMVTLFKRRRRRRLGPQTPSRPTDRQRAGLVVLALVQVTVMVWYLRPIPAPLTFTSQSNAAGSGPSAVPARLSGEIAAPAAIAADITQALAAQSWPGLTPAIGNLASAKAPEWKDCGNVGEAQVARCTFATTGTPTAAKTAVVIGDSIAISWLPSIRAALEPAGWTVVALTYGQCPAAQVDVNQQVGAASTFTAQCNAHRNWAIAKVASIKPGLVILSSAENSMSRMSSGATGAAAAAQWQTATGKTISAVQQAGAARVVVMAPPPAGKSLEACATKDSTPGTCVGTVSPTWHLMTAAERAATVAAKATYLDTQLLFCSVNEYCPPFIGTTPIRVDGNHITAVYADRVAPSISTVLRGL